MANVNIDVQLKVIGNGVAAITSATKELVDLEKQSKSVTASFGRIAEIGLGNVFADIAASAVNLAVQGFGKLESFILDSVDAAIQAEDSVNKLNFALASSGNFSIQASEDFQKFAESIQETTKFEDDAIISTGAFIAQLTGLSGKSLQDATLATADLATALGKDLDSAAQILARSLEGNVGALKKLGIEVRKGATDAETFNNVITALNEKGFGGASQNAVNTFGGSLAKLNNTFNSFQEQVGFLITKNTALIPIFNEVTSIILQFTKALIDNGPVIKSYIADAIGLGAGITKVGLKIADLFINTLSPIGNLDLFKGTAESLNKIQGAAAASADFVGPAIDKATLSIKNQKAAIADLTAEQQSSVDAGIALTTSLQETAATKFATEVEGERIRLEAGLQTQQEFADHQIALRDEQFKIEKEQRDAAFAANKVSLDQAGNAEIAATTKLANDKAKIRLAEQKAREADQKRNLQTVSDTFGNLATLQSAGGKTAFEIGKAAAIAQAGVNTYIGVSNALAGPPTGPPFPLNIIFAASQAVALGATIARLSSTKPPALAGGLTEVPPGFSGDTFPAFLNSGERVVSAPQNSDLKQFLSENNNNQSILESIRDLLSSGSQRVVVNVGGREIVNVLNDEIASGMVLRTA